MRRCLLIQAKVRSTTHLRGRTSKTCRSRLATISTVIFMAVAQAASLPAAYPASAQIRTTFRQARCRFHSNGRAASRSWTEAAVITTASTRPMASTAMCRLRPLTFLALSQPRVAFGTVAAALTDCESMTAAVGSGRGGQRSAPGRATGRAVVPGAVVAPGARSSHRRCAYQREVRGQVPPRAPGPVQVQDRLHGPADRPDPRPAPPPGHLGGQVHGDDLRLGIGQVTGIAPGVPFGPPRTLGARGPPLVFDRHKIRIMRPAPGICTAPPHTAISGRATDPLMRGPSGRRPIYQTLTKSVNLQEPWQCHGPARGIAAGWSCMRQWAATILGNKCDQTACH